MSYETRGGKQYYYYVRRVDGRLRKTYLGNGPEAEKIAAEVSRRQRERAETVRCEAELERVLVSFQPEFDNFWSCSELILQLAFRAANYHFIDSEWRRRREPRP